MKKQFILLVIVFTLLSISTKLICCPDGYTPVTNSVTINTCEYKLTFCYKCGIGPNPLAFIQIQSFEKIDPNCNQTWSTDQVLNALENYLKDQITQLCNSAIPPCGQGFKYFQMKRSKCWTKTNINGNILYEVCNNCYCCTPYKYCWDPALQRVIVTLNGIPFWDCSTGCSDPEPADPEPGYSTGCFYLSTSCN